MSNLVRTAGVPDYGAGGEPLTATERERLRPSVNVAALERWLAATHGEMRRAIIAHFADEVTDEDLIAVRRAAGASEDELAALSAIDDDAGLPPMMHEPSPGASSDALKVRFIPSWQPIVAVIRPDDLALCALWDAIEPEADTTNA
jgi:hypothetical protein